MAVKTNVNEFEIGTANDISKTIQYKEFKIMYAMQCKPLRNGSRSNEQTCVLKGKKVNYGA